MVALALSTLIGSAEPVDGVSLPSLPSNPTRSDLAQLPLSTLAKMVQAKIAPLTADMEDSDVEIISVTHAPNDGPLNTICIGDDSDDELNDCKPYDKRQYEEDVFQTESLLDSKGRPVPLAFQSGSVMDVLKALQTKPTKDVAAALLASVAEDGAVELGLKAAEHEGAEDAVPEPVQKETLGLKAAEHEGAEEMNIDQEESPPLAAPLAKRRKIRRKPAAALEAAAGSKSADAAATPKATPVDGEAAAPMPAPGAKPADAAATPKPAATPADGDGAAPTAAAGAKPADAAAAPVGADAAASIILKYLPAVKPEELEWIKSLPPQLFPRPLRLTNRKHGTKSYTLLAACGSRLEINFWKQYIRLDQTCQGKLNWPTDLPTKNLRFEPPQTSDELWVRVRDNLCNCKVDNFEQA